MEELEKELNQDSDEEIPPDAQDPNPEVNIDDYILQLMNTTKKNTPKRHCLPSCQIRRNPATSSTNLPLDQKEYLYT